MQQQKQTKSKEEVVLLTICSAFVVAVSFFAIMRAMNNEWLIAALDVFLSFVMLLLGLYIHIARKLHIARMFFSVIVLSGIIATIYIKGLAQILWSYPALISLFYVVNPTIAIRTSVIFILILFYVVNPIMDIQQLITYYVTLSITIFFAYVFSKQTMKQKDKLVTISMTDPLTNTKNRRALDYKLDEIKDIQQISEHSFCLIILDIDNFKIINDTHGHTIGDEILVKLTKKLSSRLRKSDDFYRYGGEEFIIILPYTELKQAQIVAEELRKTVEKIKIDNDIKVTISLGVAEHVESESKEEWISRADKALYQAKNSGRNACFLAEK